jgi:CAAX prenyl protease-like protein
MDFLKAKLRQSAIHARMVPYIILVGLLFLQDGFGPDMRYWMYLVRMLVGAYCIWLMWDLVPEMRWAFSIEAVVVGVLVCVIWVGLDPYYPKLSFLFTQGEPWNPVKHYGEGSLMAFFFVAVRTLGSAIVVPPLEEAFYRSFLYRWFIRKDFENLPFRHFHWLSFLVTAVLFGFVHFQWFAGILCAMAYQWLVIRKDRLGDAITAHAITNFLLGIWIYWKGAWHFW